MESKWCDLSTEEKREERFKRWLSPPDGTSPSPDVEKGHQERVARFIKAIKLEEPDRVPVVLPSGVSPAYFAGSTLKRVMYDYLELRRAWLKFLDDFDLDTASSAAVAPSGRALEIIDARITRWPGHGLGDDVRSQQFVEGEYMTADEYNAFIKIPGIFS